MSRSPARSRPCALSNAWTDVRALHPLRPSLSLIHHPPESHWLAFGHLRETHCHIQGSSSQNANLEPEREFAPYFACSSSHSTDRSVSWSCAKWGAANAPSHLRYDANPQPLYQCFTTAGAVCGGRLSAKREKGALAILTAKSEGSRSPLPKPKVEVLRGEVCEGW